MLLTKEKHHFKEIITSKWEPFRLHLKEIKEYKDLLLLLTRRDIIALYKQTILGPLWFFLQPLLTTFIYVIVFSRVGRFSTGDLPPVLFYLSGLVLWLYFSECILRTATFFKDYTAVFSKVYFPRLVVPLSVILTNLVKLSIQLFLFFILYFYFFSTDTRIQPNAIAWLLPILILLIGLMGLGFGLLAASLTTRYKDLTHLISFGVQLLMFASPVIFPLQSFEESGYSVVLKLNPLAGIIETFRYGFLGKGHFSWNILLYDTIFTFALLAIAIFAFNTVERKFVDTI